MQMLEAPHVSFIQRNQPHLAPPMLGLHYNHFLRHQYPSTIYSLHTCTLQYLFLIFACSRLLKSEKKLKIEGSEKKLRICKTGKTISDENSEFRRGGRSSGGNDSELRVAHGSCGNDSELRVAHGSFLTANLPFVPDIKM